MILEKLAYIVSQFEIQKEVLKIERFGSGHINDTFRVSVDGDHNDSYLLQKVNHHIFKDVDGLMHNIFLVTEHLKKKFEIIGDDVYKRTLTIVPTRDGHLYYRTVEGDFWRIFVLLNDTKTYDIVTTKKQAYSGGQAFGQFQKQLADLDAKELVDVLPDFHNIDFRLDNLRKAIRENRMGRVVEVEDILSFINEREQSMRRILSLADQGKLPLRIIHNDTKFNNVLLDLEDNVQCVIDLDTVMAGYVAYDFGDAIRTIINSAAEDEKDLNKIQLNIALFKAYTEGYLSETRAFLTDTEIDSLMYGVQLLPYMQAVRFLTDYLEGDVYYKTYYADQNLIRTKAQLRLVQELESHEEKLLDIMNKCLLVL